jgi:hypothetical protein
MITGRLPSTHSNTHLVGRASVATPDVKITSRSVQLIFIKVGLLMSTEIFSR